MKEVTFIRRNIEKWKETEKVVERAASLSPDQLADAYTDLTADLAFAQTHFPTSRITIYLNNLASALHNEIYRNKREEVDTDYYFLDTGSATNHARCTARIIDLLFDFCCQRINRRIISSE